MVAAAAGLLAGCGPTPVGRVAVSPAAVTLAAGTYAPLAVEFEPATALPARAEPLVFLHLLADDGTLVRTFDHPLPAAWRPDQKIVYAVEIHQSALGPALPAGTYRLTLGLLSGTTRLPLATAGRTRGRLEYEVATVTVPASPATPEFTFTGDSGATAPAWGELEPGGDRQVVGRRWLLSAGGLELTAPTAGSVLISLLIPAETSGASNYELAPGTTEPMLYVRGAAGDQVISFAGPGPHRAEIPLQAGPNSLVLEPKFILVDHRDGSHRVAVLETLAWRAVSP